MVPSRIAIVASLLCAGPCLVAADESVHIAGLPDYTWYAGCFGTAGANLMGYWDRNGFPNFYTGPTARGIAPLDAYGPNIGIRSLWISRAGFDGRPADQPGHAEDYWQLLTDSAFSFESPAPDPYLLAGRPEHEPDCISDFIGASQNKWPDLNGECSGNVDGYAFNFWNKDGLRLENFIPPNFNGQPIRDIQSGLRNWARSRGTEANVFSQLADFNPTVPEGAGFTFEDLKAEIDAGYPVFLIVQEPTLSRPIGDMPRANGRAHAMVAYGYFDLDDGRKMVRYRDSWGSGDGALAEWGPGLWAANMPLRGVITFHPLPRITNISPEPTGLRLRWDGPSSTLANLATGQTWPAHHYVIEKATSLNPSNFLPITEPTTAREIVLPNFNPLETAFFRVKLLPPN